MSDNVVRLDDYRKKPVVETAACLVSGEKWRGSPGLMVYYDAQTFINETPSTAESG